MTVRSRIEVLEAELRLLKKSNDVLERQVGMLTMRCDRYQERIRDLELKEHICNCKAQPTNNITPSKEITIKVPYDIICE